MRAITLLFDEKMSFVASAKYKGNGYIRKSHGVELTRMPNHVALNPVGEKGKITATSFEVPIDKIDLFIEALQEIKRMNS